MWRLILTILMCLDLFAQSEQILTLKHLSTLTEVKTFQSYFPDLPPLLIQRSNLNKLKRKKIYTAGQLLTMAYGFLGAVNCALNTETATNSDGQNIAGCPANNLSQMTRGALIFALFKGWEIIDNSESCSTCIEYAANNHQISDLSMDIIIPENNSMGFALTFTF